MICCFLGSNAGREGVGAAVGQGGEMGGCKSTDNEPSLTFTAHQRTDFGRDWASQFRISYYTKLNGLAHAMLKRVLLFPKLGGHVRLQDVGRFPQYFPPK